MILIHYFLIVVVSCFGTCLEEDGKDCNCRCWDRKRICEDLKALRTTLDVATNHKTEWKELSDFVQNFNCSWDDKVAKVAKQQLKEMSDDSSSYLKESQKLEMSSTLKPVKDMNIEDSVLHMQQKLSNVEERLSVLENRYLEEEVQNIKHQILEEVKKAEMRFAQEKTELAEKITEMESAFASKQNDLTTKLDEMLNRFSEIEKTSNQSLGEMSERLLLEKNKLLVMDNHLLFEVHQMQKKALETFEKITDVENLVRNVSDRGQMKTDLLQVRLNETIDSCHASQRKTEETMHKNSQILKTHVDQNLVSRLENVQSNLTARMGRVENSLEEVREKYENLNNLSNHHQIDFELTVKNRTYEIREMKQDIFRLQTICSPACENGGKCVKNVCNCTPSFTGYRCQEAICSPPCENGGQCMKNNNTCSCMPLFYGDRCQDWPQCGVDHSADINGSSSPLMWPWLAAVYRKRITATQHFCDGSVIQRHFILTSAWCVNHYDIHRDREVTVKLGFSALKEGTELQEYTVRSIHIHPQYKHGSADLDHAVALLELEKPIEYNNFVRPVCLPPKEVSQDKQFYKPQSSAKVIDLDVYIRAVSGSGNTSPNILKGINLTIQPSDFCRREQKEKGWDKYFASPDLSFCAVFSSTCPTRRSPVMQLQLSGKDTQIWTQIGIINWCFENRYLYNLRLQNFMPWIDATMKAALRK